MKILVTGGAGYIGSHTCLELLMAGHDIHVVDNLDNGHKMALERIQEFTKRDLSLSVVDIRNTSDLSEVFLKTKPDIVIHFAGLKAVAESVKNPLQYYDVNVQGTVSLLKAMQVGSCTNIIFSSSATVYGNPEYLPYDELHPTNPVNPYGKTKRIVEYILEDWVAINKNNKATALRYFNPVGAHPSGCIGEDPNGIPNNLMPLISQVGVGRRDQISIFGNNYDTRDGTGERDYIHVVDLAKAHVATLEKQDRLEPYQVLNIGRGQSTTVLELIHAFEKTNNITIAHKIADNRPGDLPAFWADPSVANNLLNWYAQETIETICADTWNWQKNNTSGYSS